jgi:hypothetical protein
MIRQFSEAADSRGARLRLYRQPPAPSTMRPYIFMPRRPKPVSEKYAQPARASGNTPHPQLFAQPSAPRQKPASLKCPRPRSPAAQQTQRPSRSCTPSCQVAKPSQGTERCRRQRIRIAEERRRHGEQAERNSPPFHAFLLPPPMPEHVQFPRHACLPRDMSPLRHAFRLPLLHGGRASLCAAWCSVGCA